MHRIPPQVACIVVELRSRIYDVIPLPKMSDVIGPIYSGYVPFCPWYLIRNSLLCIEVARLEEPVHVYWISVNPSYEFILSRLKSHPAAGIEPRSPRTTEFYEANALPQS